MESTAKFLDDFRFFIFSILVLKSEVILHEAARKNNADVVRRLVAAKVNINCTNNVSVYTLTTGRCNHWPP